MRRNCAARGCHRGISSGWMSRKSGAALTGHQPRSARGPGCVETPSEHSTVATRSVLLDAVVLRLALAALLQLLGCLLFAGLSVLGHVARSMIARIRRAATRASRAGLRATQ